MSGPSTSDLAGHLVRTANALPERAELLARIVAERMRWANDGSAPVVLDLQGQPALDAAGTPVTPGALLARYQHEMPSFFAPPASPMQPQTTAGRLGMTGDTAKAAAEHAASQQRQTTGERPNPWATGTRNLTEQVRLEARDPARAAQLKAEAGAR